MINLVDGPNLSTPHNRPIATQSAEEKDVLVR